jgi:hypothetical protein
MAATQSEGLSRPVCARACAFDEPYALNEIGLTQVEMLCWRLARTTEVKERQSMHAVGG